MPTFPPPEPPHRYHRAGPQNSPLQDLHGYGAIEIPIIPQAGLSPAIGADLESGTNLDEKPYPRRRFASPFPQLRGSGLLVLHWAFFTGESIMVSWTASLMQWPPSPTTVIGISGLLGAIASAAAGQITWAVAVPMVASCVTMIVLPDNASAKDAARQLAADAVVAKSIGAAPVLVTDAEHLATAIEAAPAKPAP